MGDAQGNGEVGGGNGRTETAVDESMKETAKRVARYQTDSEDSWYLYLLPVQKTASVAVRVLLL